HNSSFQRTSPVSGASYNIKTFILLMQMFFDGNFEKINFFFTSVLNKYSNLPQSLDRELGQFQ
ncbi:MAG: hypothetical protein JXB44_11930, partial [Calditrichaceae bacterium]|nr:hypothetical protein [Calditrichaceae bacterium]